MKKLSPLLTLFLFAFLTVFGQKNALYYEILQAKELNVVFMDAVLHEASPEIYVLNSFINFEEVFFFNNISIDLINNEIKALNLTLPLKNKDITLELVEVPKYFYAYEIIAKDGESFPVSRDIKHYRGIVKDNYNSIAAVTFFEDEIMGLVCTDEGNFNIVKDSVSGKFIYYNSNNLIEKTFPIPNNVSDFSSSFSYAPEVLFRERMLFGDDEKRIFDPGLNKIIKIYVETRYNIYIRHGSNVKNVEKNITGIFNQVAALYANEEIHVGILCLCMHRSSDPYSYGAKACQLVEEFIDETTSLKGADLGIVLSYRNENGGCTKSIEGLCNESLSKKLAAANIDKDYKEVMEYSWSVHCITHELGHLLGSYDTHACEWNNDCSPIDGCNRPDYPFLLYNNCTPCGSLPDPYYPLDGGTIMSYCHLTDRPGVKFINGFGQQPGNVIRESVRNADCLQCLTPENIANQTISTNCTIVGCKNLNFENVTITNNANVNIYASEMIWLKSGFQATAGTNVSISIVNSTTSLSPPQNSMVVINNENLDILEETESNEINLNRKPEIKLYPNPNSGTFQLETNFPLSDISTIKITNVLGIRVYEAKNIISNTIQLKSSSSGLHFVQVFLNNGNVLTLKMMIQW